MVFLQFVSAFMWQPIFIFIFFQVQPNSLISISSNCVVKSQFEAQFCCQSISEEIDFIPYGVRYTYLWNMISLRDISGRLYFVRFGLHAIRDQEILLESSRYPSLSRSYRLQLQGYRLQSVKIGYGHNLYDFMESGRILSSRVYCDLHHITSFRGCWPLDPKLRR